MKSVIKAAIVTAVLGVAAFGAPTADAKGCLKGAVVGGVAGHMAGHGALGAAGGCAVGHHMANKNERAADQRMSRDDPASRYSR